MKMVRENLWRSIKCLLVCVMLYDWLYRNTRICIANLEKNVANATTTMEC